MYKMNSIVRLFCNKYFLSFTCRINGQRLSLTIVNSYMSTTLNKYRYYCQDEQKLVYQWASTNPTRCPNNDKHSIDNESITIVDSVSTNTVVIKDSISGETQEYFMLEGFNKSVTQSGLNKFTIVYPFPICVYHVNLKPSTENIGDVVDAYTVIYITLASSFSNNYVVFDDISIISMMPRGTFLSNNDKIIGRLVNVDSNTSRVYLDRVIDQNVKYMTNDVEFRLYLVHNVSIHNTNNILVGDGKVGGKVINANLPIIITYDNISNSDKRFAFDIQYLY